MDLTDEFQAVRRALFEAEAAHAAWDRDAALDAARQAKHCFNELLAEIINEDPADAEIREQVRLDGLARKADMMREL